MDPGTRLDDLLARADLAEVERWLTSATDEHRRAARPWAKRLARRLARDGITPVGSYDVWSRQWWVVAMVVLACETPAVAGRHPCWGWVHDWQEPGAVERLERLLGTRSAEWAESFVPRAADLSDGDVVMLFRLLRGLVLAHRLPVPAGRLFVQGWVIAMSDQADLTAALTSDPLMPDALHRLLPSGLVHQLPGLPGAMPELVGSGMVDRIRLRDQALDLLTTASLTVGTQRSLARLLAAIGLAADEVPGGLPLVQGLVATCHGSVGVLLLPLALQLVERGDDLVELATTIGARPEKAQKTTLLRALASDTLRTRVGAAAVLTSLDRLEGDDHALLTAIERVRASLGGAVQPATPVVAPAGGLWTLPLPSRAGEPPRRIGEWPGLVDDARRALGHELSSPSTHTRPDVGVLGDLTLAALVREAATRPADLVRADLVGLAGLATDQRSVLGEAVVDWCAEPGTAAYQRAFGQVGVLHTTATGHLARPYSLVVPATAFRYLLTFETLERLGRSVCLLSTPSHSDHSISWEALVPRLELNDGRSVGALDLAQTLLRLRPVDPVELTRLDGLRVAVDDSVTTTGEPTGVSDVAQVLRDWVAGGGLPRLRPEVRDGVWRADPDLPLPPRLLATLPAGFLNQDESAYRSDEVVRTVPGWPDLALLGRRALAAPETSFLTSSDYVLGKDFPLAAHTWDLLLAELVDRDPRSRERAVTTCLQLMAEGRFDVDGFAHAALARLGAGTLTLTTLVPTWELLAREGALSRLWPALVATADAACTAARRPSGTPELLRLLQQLAVEVPDVVVPPGVRSLAEARGTSKSHHEARELVRRVNALRAG